MAKQVIGIGTTANDGTGDQVRVAFDKTNQNFTELYDSQLSTSDDLTEGATNKYLLDDSVVYSKLGSEFTTSGSLVFDAGWLYADFSTAQVFNHTFTNGLDTFIAFSNAEVGMVKDLILTGDYTIAFVDNPTIISGTYDGTVANLIQVIVTAPNTYYMSISQPQV